MDAVAAAVAALGAADRYAKEIVAWQARLDAWEAAFFAWQGDGKLIPPPTPPTTSRWPTTDEVKSAQREAAYNAAGIVRSAATLAPNLVLARLTALLRVYCTTVGSTYCRPALSASGAPRAPATDRPLVASAIRALDFVVPRNDRRRRRRHL